MTCRYGLVVGVIATVLLAASPGSSAQPPPTKNPDTSPRVSEARIRELIGRLDSSTFEQRSKAQAELRALGPVALSPLRQALRTSRSLEVQRRVEQLLVLIEHDHLNKIGSLGKEAFALAEVPIVSVSRSGGFAGGFGGGPAPRPVVANVVGKAYMPAVCVHPSGLFLTNAKPLSSAREQVIRLIVHPGSKAQKIVSARIIQAETSLDLALLEAQERVEVPALPLGLGEGISELASVFPLTFSDPAKWEPGKYPASRPTQRLITALHRREGELFRLQLEAGPSPEEVLGPLLDDQGKLIGLASSEAFSSSVYSRSRVASASVSASSQLVIPLDRIRAFLARPIIQFAPPVLRTGDRHKPATFQARVRKVLPGTPSPQLDLLIMGKEKARHFKMNEEKGVYSVQASPEPATTPEPLWNISFTFKDGAINTRIADREIRTGKDSLRLSEIRTLKPGPEGVKATLLNGKEKILPLSALNDWTVEIGGARQEIPFARVLEAHIQPPQYVPAIPCMIVATQDGKEVGRVAGVIVVRNTLTRHALYLDGQTSLVTIPTFHYDGSYPITIEAIVTPYRRGAQAVLGDNTAEAGLGLQLDPGGSNKWEFSAFLGKDNRRAVGSKATLLKQRTHVVGVYDLHSLTLYVNGKKEQSIPLDAKARLERSPLSFTVGAYQQADGQFAAPFQGLIESVRISRGARYTGDFRPLDFFEADDQTLVLLPMNEGSGRTCYDVSGNQHHGQLHGVHWLEVPPQGFPTGKLPFLPPAGGE
jgi:S1-C subfamily serine protease